MFFLPITFLTGLTAAPGNLRIPGSTATLLQFAWDAIPCGSRGGLISYRYTLDTTPPRTGITAATSIALGDLDPCTTYVFVVMASNSVGDGGESSTTGDTLVASKLMSELGSR